jgi:hypothetical protein
MMNMEFLRAECGLLFPQACTVLNVYDTERGGGRGPSGPDNSSTTREANVTLFTNEHRI